MVRTSIKEGIGKLLALSQCRLDDLELGYIRKKVADGLVRVRSLSWLFSVDVAVAVEAVLPVGSRVAGGVHYCEPCANKLDRSRVKNNILLFGSQRSSSLSHAHTLKKKLWIFGMGRGHVQDKRRIPRKVPTPLIDYFSAEPQSILIYFADIRNIASRSSILDFFRCISTSLLKICLRK
jgi:hypothetical protein